MVGCFAEHWHVQFVTSCLTQELHTCRNREHWQLLTRVGSRVRMELGAAELRSKCFPKSRLEHTENIIILYVLASESKLLGLVVELGGCGPGAT